MKQKPEEYSLEYAGFWIRLAAGLIDLMILLTSIYVLYCVVSQSFFWILPDMQRVVQSFRDISNGAPVSASIIWLIATVLLVFLLGCTAYFVTCWAIVGQTVGKMSVGIKIIRTDSSPLNLRYAFIRFLASLLCVLTLGIGFIVIAFDSRKQGWHDRLADTYVVKLPVKQLVYNQTLARGGIG